MAYAREGGFGTDLRAASLVRGTRAAITETCVWSYRLPSYESDQDPLSSSLIFTVKMSALGGLNGGVLKRVEEAMTDAV